MVTHGEQHGAENGHHGNLYKRGPILQVGTFARAPDIYSGDHRDHGYADEGARDWRERNDFGEVTRASACQRGDGAAGDDQEKTPAIKKRWHAAEAVANVAVQTAGFWIGGGELGVSKCAEERKDAANEPDQQG